MGENRVDRISKVHLNYPVYHRGLDFSHDELTELELIAKLTGKTNELVDYVNGWDGSLNEMELKEHLTNSRKLSPKGNFTGTIYGKPASSVVMEIGSNTDKITYLINQFSDGQTGLVIDGGWFEESGIDKNYDGGIF